uniref:spondin-1-like n=1 Tax=Ciona intestinalis TaxID=7719 RepID=UPI00052184A4|nr:spondin-1-like [Ciona intestinalis]|eukprot:XP_026693407.1 spondin-1-like [Ciona intestinalis]
MAKFTVLALMLVVCGSVQAWGSNYVSPNDRDCIVSRWSRWSRCEYNRAYPTYNSCQFRTRTIRVSPQGNGAACPELVQVRACQPQPVRCEWSAWSQCSSDGSSYRSTRTRTRQCHPFSETEDCEEPVTSRPIPPNPTLPPIQATNPPPTSGGKRKCRRGRRRSGSRSGSSGSDDSSCSDSDDSDSDNGDSDSGNSHPPRSRSRGRSRSRSPVKKSGNNSSNSDRSRSRSKSRSRSGSPDNGGHHNYRTTTRW